MIAPGLSLIAMKTLQWIVCLVIVPLTLLSTRALAGTACGGRGMLCSDEEQCCEYTMAIFNGDGAVTPPYREGRCAPKNQKCGDFWCGNRHCESGFFGTPSVCCVEISPAGASAYVCAHSELSCPGNTQQLSIRDTASHRTPSGT